MGLGFFVLNVFVIATSLWVLFDSQSLGVSVNGEVYSSNNGAIEWMAFCFLLWIVALPYYLSRRAATLRQPYTPESYSSRNGIDWVPSIIYVGLMVLWLLIGQFALSAMTGA